MATSAVSSATEAIKGVVNTAIGAVSGNQEGEEVRGVTDESPQVDDAKKNLERKLSLRPERDELVERNILRNTTVAPGLQAAQAELQRAQLEDKLEQKLLARPKPDALVKEGILNADEVPGV